MQTIVKDVLLNYQVYGKSGKATVLILHGWGRDLKDWISVAEALSIQAKVILLDLPGFGSSYSRKTQTFTLEEYAQIISDFINKLDIKNVVLLGHSVGGKISVVLTAKDTNISKLILVSPSGFNKKPISVVIKLIIYRIVKPALILLPGFVKGKLISVVASDDYLSSGKMKTTFKNVLSADVTRLAQKISVPTLIVWGEQDREVPLPGAKRLQSYIQGSVLRVIWRSDHHPHIEKKNQFIEIIKEFI